MKKIMQHTFWAATVFLFSIAPFVYAQESIFNPNCGSTSLGLQNPLSVCTFADFVTLLLTGVIRIGIPIAVLFIMYSGLLFVTAQGSEDKLKKAKETFFYTIVGVTLFVGSIGLALIIKNTIEVITG